MSPRKRPQIDPTSSSSADQAQETLRTMEAALRQKIGEAPEGSEEKRHLQELLSLLSGQKAPEAPPTASKAPTPSVASILEEMGVPMIRSSRRLDFGSMERAMCCGSPQRRHFRIGLMAPPQDRVNGATPGSG